MPTYCKGTTKGLSREKEFAEQSKLRFRSSCLLSYLLLCCALQRRRKPQSHNTYMKLGQRHEYFAGYQERPLSIMGARFRQPCILWTFSLDACKQANGRDSQNGSLGLNSFCLGYLQTGTFASDMERQNYFEPCAFRLDLRFSLACELKFTFLLTR